MAEQKDIARYISSGAWALVSSYGSDAQSLPQVEPIFSKEGKATLAKLIDFMEVCRAHRILRRQLMIERHPAKRGTVPLADIS